MTLRTKEGFFWMRAVGYVSIFVFVLTTPPLFLTKNADSTFLIPSILGILFGIAGSLFSRVLVEIGPGKRIRAYRPYWRGESFDGPFDETLKIAIVEKQPGYGALYLPILTIEIPDQFYIQKKYHFFGAKKRALEDYKLVQQAAYGEIRNAEYPKQELDPHSDEWRPESWEGILALLGLPVELNEEDRTEKPWLTWSLAAVTVAISSYAWIAVDGFTNEWGFQVAEPWRHGGATFLTHFFLHADLFHLLGNMYFFLVFADNVELYLGRFKFMILLVGATIAASALELFGYRGETVLAIGASGGIFGVVTFYLCRFTHRKFGLFIFGKWVQVPAVWLFVIFSVFQAIGLFSARDGVSYWAHLGGIAVGFFWGILRPKTRA